MNKTQQANWNKAIDDAFATATWDPSKPPPPFGLTVLGRHGSKFKVRIGKLTKIVDREKILQWAAERRAVGGPVQLMPYIQE
jgi:hypothetical protein